MGSAKDSSDSTTCRGASNMSFKQKKGLAPKSTGGEREKALMKMLRFFFNDNIGIVVKFLGLIIRLSNTATSSG